VDAAAAVVSVSVSVLVLGTGGGGERERERERERGACVRVHVRTTSSFFLLASPSSLAGGCVKRAVMAAPLRRCLLASLHRG